METNENTYRPPAADVSAARPDAGRRTGVGSSTIEELTGTRPWVLFISIMMFIGTAFMVVVGLFMVIMIFAGSAAMMEEAGLPGGAGAAIGVFYLFIFGVSALIYFMFAWFLFKYAKAIKDLSQSASEIDLNAALASQRKFWRLAGVILLLVIGMYALIFLAAILIPLLTA